ncbi:MAG: DUF2235 domain-containing protein, partial [Myxococcales bacterium]|nr:DUF2235 domain-containing protein [Myxococcales bacterium]
MATAEATVADEATRRGIAEGFAETPPTPPVAGCGPARALELGCFFDGTGNNRWLLPADTSETNVVRLHDSYPTGTRADGAAVRDRHYLIGVGAGTAGQPGQPTTGTGLVDGGGLGIGTKERVNLMYAWVKQKIEDHARVCDPESNIAVRFLGVFDTVESIPGSSQSAEAPNCHVENSDYRAARHFTARHEIRANFPLTKLDPGGKSVAYPGVHCDVGGGYVDGDQGKRNWLSFVTLVDMHAACRAQGIEMGGVSIPPGCDVSPRSVLRTGSDEELQQFIHRADEDPEVAGEGASALERVAVATRNASNPNFAVAPNAQGVRERGIAPAEKMRIVGRPPDFGWTPW